MPLCVYCQEETPEDHLHAIVEAEGPQCPFCIEHWCDDWEPVAKQLTDVIRERNREPLARFLEWMDHRRQERKGSS